jgi:tetratricopeptide (TPR) repeat protein
MLLPRPRASIARPRALLALLALAAACQLAEPAFAADSKSAATTLIQRGGALFEDQQYEESIQTLSAALLRPGTSEAEKIETYRLLAYNYIILKRTEEADAAVRGIFVLSEKFSLPPTESPRFRDFFDATRKKWIDEGRPGKVTAGAATAVEKPIKMDHASPAEAPSGATLKLTGTIDDPDGRVRGVQLAYRTGSNAKFITIAGTYSLGQFRTQIPGLAVKAPLIEYYLQAVDKSGLPLTSRGDAAAPLRVVVPKEGGVLTSPFFWVPVGVTAVAGGVLAAFFLVNNRQKTSTVTIGVKE